MSLSVAGFPQDVLLELFKHLDVTDLITFLSICRIIRELQCERTLWIHALIRLKQVEMQPLPLPLGKTLDVLSLHELQNTVRRANRLALRLANNLKSDHPRPARICPLFVEPGARIFCIPGANLIVTHITGSVSCWDTLTSHRVAYQEIPDLRIQITAPRNVRYLAAVWIDFLDRTHISISHTTSQATNDASFFRSHLFMNSQALGFCTESHIIFWGLEDNGRVEVHPQKDCCPPSSPTPACLLFGRRLYIFRKGGNLRQAKVYNIPFSEPSKNQLSTTNIDPPSTTVLPISYPFHPNQEALTETASLFSFTVHVHSPHVVAPEYGVYAVTCTDLGNRPLSVVYFWPARPSAAHDGMLDIGPGCAYGHAHLIRQMSIGATGRYVLIRALGVTGEESSGAEGEEYLGLLHLPPRPPHDDQSTITFRKLDIGATSLQSCQQIALDDSLGLALVLDNTGRLTAISFL
ncbi:hypothetical protein DFH09DRAFT_1193274 [Mycena vulgaris]|nr:hypothetical protein DFH09DRAFT_1193274 [Mycena vulgaris]